MQLTIDSNDEQEMNAASGIDALADTILRHLARCEWLIRETQSDFTSTFAQGGNRPALFEGVGQHAGPEAAGDLERLRRLWTSSAKASR